MVQDPASCGLDDGHCWHSDGVGEASRSGSQLPATVSTASRPVDYNWDVRPILSENCFRATGPTKRAGWPASGWTCRSGLCGTEIAAKASTPSCPGNPEESELIRRVSAENRCGTHAAATVEQGADRRSRSTCFEALDRARRRVQAALGVHRPEKPVPPVVKPARRVANEIDRFVLAAWSAKGCSFSPEADKETLINRVTPDADRAAADAGRGRRVPEGQQPRRIREGRRSAAGVAGLRRAHGRVLAEHRPLRRERRLPRRLPRPAVLAVSRLGDRRVQQEHAVRPVRRPGSWPATCCRPHQGAEARDGVPARRQAHDRERRASTRNIASSTPSIAPTPSGRPSSG